MTIWTEVHGAEVGGMSWNDGDIVSGKLDKLYLAWRASREGNDLVVQAQEAERVVCGFED